MRKTFIMIIAVLGSVMIARITLAALLASLLVLGTLTEHLLSDRGRDAVKNPTSPFRFAFSKDKMSF